MQLPEHGANPHNVYEKLGIELPLKNRWILVKMSIRMDRRSSCLQNVARSCGESDSLSRSQGGTVFVGSRSISYDLKRQSLFIGNGAAELLALIAERYRGKKAIVVHPTFSEYEATLKAKNVEIIRVLSSEERWF